MRRHDVGKSKVKRSCYTALLSDGSAGGGWGGGPGGEERTVSSIALEALGP